MTYWRQTTGTFDTLDKFSAYDLGFLIGIGTVNVSEYANWEPTSKDHQLYLQGLKEGVESWMNDVFPTKNEGHN